MRVVGGQAADGANWPFISMFYEGPLFQRRAFLPRLFHITKKFIPLMGSHISSALLFLTFQHAFLITYYRQHLAAPA